MRTKDLPVLCVTWGPGVTTTTAGEAGTGQAHLWGTFSISGNRKHLRSFMKGVTISLHRRRGGEKKLPVWPGWASLVVQLVKNPPAMWETWVQSLGWEDPLEKRKLPTPVFLGFPCDLAGKESTHNAGEWTSRWGVCGRDTRTLGGLVLNIARHFQKC